MHILCGSCDTSSAIPKTVCFRSTKWMCQGLVVPCTGHKRSLDGRTYSRLRFAWLWLVLTTNIIYRFLIFTVKLYNVLTLPLVSPTLPKLMYSDIGSYITMNLELPRPFPPADISSTTPAWQLWYHQCNSKNRVFSVQEMNVSIATSWVLQVSKHLMFSLDLLLYFSTSRWQLQILLSLQNLSNTWLA